MPLIRQIVLVLAATAAAGCPNDSLAPETSPDSSTADTAGSLGVGTPCDVLAVNPGPTQAIFNNQALECPSRICLKPLRAESLTADIDTGPYCSAICSKDSDCDGQRRDGNDPADKHCQKGYACGVAFVVGPLCCKKLCLCKDFLATGGLQTPLTCDPKQNNGGTACQE